MDVVSGQAHRVNHAAYGVFSRLKAVVSVANGREERQYGSGLDLQRTGGRMGCQEAVQRRPVYAAPHSSLGRFGGIRKSRDGLAVEEASSVYTR